MKNVFDIGFNYDHVYTETKEMCIEIQNYLMEETI